MKRAFVLTLALVFLLLPTAAFADHLPPSLVVPVGPPADVPLVNQGGVRYLGNMQTGRGTAAVFGDNAPFERDGKRYQLTGNSIYGLSVIDVTDPIRPKIVSEYAAAFGCPQANAEALQADTFSPFTPMGGFENDLAMTPDGRIAVLGMDDSGRCHDPIHGGLEFIDLTDVTNPRALHLTRNVGYAHSVSVDPKYPWLAYALTSDGNDIIDITDFSSCMGGVAELDKCRPTMHRVILDPEWPGMAGLAKPPGSTPGDYATAACHDLRFRGDRGYCAAIDSTIIFDTSGVLDANGKLTGTDMTKGPDACNLIDATSAAGVKVTDCMGWTKTAFKERKATTVGMKVVSLVSHDGDPRTGADDDLGPEEQVQIAHQAEAIGDGSIMIVTDERGGGLANQDGCPGGGVWFYDIRDEKHPVLMRQPDGKPGVYITQTQVPPPFSLSPSCTSHYGNEFADENILAFAWYMNGTRVMRYTPDFTKSPAQITFEELAAYIPIGTEAIHSFGIARNPEAPGEIVVYAADTVRGVDILSVPISRITRKQAFRWPSAGGTVSKPRPKPNVLGNRNLANTGVGDDPVTIGLCLLALALATKRTMRPRQTP